MTKVIALGLIAVIIGAELLAAIIFLSSTGDEPAVKVDEAKKKAAAAPARSESNDSNTVEEPEETPEPAEKADTPERATPASPSTAMATGDFEVDLGSYSLTVYQPAAGTTLLVDFHLFGTIRSKDDSAFEERFEKHKHRIRDQVIVTIRSAEMTDLADPGLGLIKRQILEKSNALLGKRLLRSIMFSDFTFIEQ